MARVPKISQPNIMPTNMNLNILNTMESQMANRFEVFINCFSLDLVRICFKVF
jgi:hypothetical protein